MIPWPEITVIWARAVVCGFLLNNRESNMADKKRAFLVDYAQLYNISRRSSRKSKRRKLYVPWVPEVFLACGGNFRCWPKAEATSGEAARKTSGTERCFLPSPLTFELFYRITFTPIRLKVSDCDHVGRHVKKCPKTHIILRKSLSVRI